MSTSAERSRSCPRSATRTSSPYMKVQESECAVRHKKLILIPGEKKQHICQSVFVWRSEIQSRKSLCWKRMRCYISAAATRVRVVGILCRASCLRVPLTPDEINQSPTHCMFLYNIVIVGPPKISINKRAKPQYFFFLGGSSSFKAPFYCPD